MLKTHLVLNEHCPFSRRSYTADEPSQDSAQDRPTGKIRHNITLRNATGQQADI